jgi:two-component system nitrogen regulation response regulator GlnG
MRELFRAIGQVAASGLGVLVTGETGTGKELVARALHRESARSSRPFVALNTGAIPAELLESELFGHEAGAFTGATRRHPGRFEQAAGGTLFLDEIGDMPLALQTRLLRVLAAGEFYRVGGRELLRADVRVISATHQDLDAKVARGEFRADLLHRLDVVRLDVPPLRARRRRTAARRALPRTRLRRSRRHPKTFLARRACRAARAHVARQRAPARKPVPPRRRALDHAHDRRHRLAACAQAIAANGEWDDALRTWAAQRLATGAVDLHGQARERFERVLLDAALEAHRGHRQNAAKALGLGRNTLTRKLGGSRPRRDGTPRR